MMSLSWVTLRRMVSTQAEQLYILLAAAATTACLTAGDYLDATCTGKVDLQLKRQESVSREGHCVSGVWQERQTALSAACHVLLGGLQVAGPARTWRPFSDIRSNHPVCAACCYPDEVDIGRKTRKRKTPASAAGKRKTRGAMTSSRVPKSFQRLLEEVRPKPPRCAAHECKRCQHPWSYSSMHALLQALMHNCTQHSTS